MFCKYCGSQNKDNYKFCSKCGKPLTTQVNMDIQNPSGGQQFNKRKRKKWPIIMIIILLVVAVGIGVGIYAIKKMEEEKERDNNRKKQEMTTIEEKSADLEEGNSTILDESTSAEENTTDLEENTSQEPELNFIQNPVDYVDYANCLDASKYIYQISPDGDYSFYYPNNLYKYGIWEGNNCYIEGGDGISELSVSEEDCSYADAMSGMREIYNKFSQKVYKLEEILVYKEANDDGFARCILSGYSDSTKTESLYLIGASNGIHNYTLEMKMPMPENIDSDEVSMELVDDEVGYAVDCVYRYCSFSGSTYRPRTYEQFLKDEAGTKK